MAIDVEKVKYALGDQIFGWVSYMPMGPPVMGQQLPNTLYRRFDRNGVCVEERVIPPAVRIVYE